MYQALFLRAGYQARFSQAFPAFRALPLPCIILNENRRTKNGGGLGTRLRYYHFLITLYYLLNAIIVSEFLLTFLEILLIIAGSSECAFVNLRVA